MSAIHWLNLTRVYVAKICPAKIRGVSVYAAATCMLATCTPSLAARAAEFVVWNVGQGLWTTWVTKDNCEHFDTGGEQAPWRALGQSCRGKINLMRFSHWDLDHISFSSLTAKRLGKTCLATPPGGIPTQSKSKMLAGFRPCNPASGDGIEIPVPDAKHSAKHFSEETSNDASRIFVLGRFLLPGDSPSRKEKLWTNRVPATSIRVLVLGHHGSQTATSTALLARHRSIKQAVASARSKKYGHPHAKVTARLKRFGIALLRTEDWGTLRFESQQPKPKPPKTIDDKPYTPCLGCVRPAHR